MLDYIRNRAKGWFAWVIVGLITVPFALWGIHNYIGGGGPTYVAKVAGVEISQNQFENIYQLQRMQWEQMFGGQLPEMLSEQMLRAQVLEELIDQEVMIQQAVAQRMNIADRHLAEVIRSVDAFYEDGRFSQQRYVDLLRREGMTPASFEQRLRRDLLTKQIESAFTASGFFTAPAVEQLLRLQMQQREFSLLHISREDFLTRLNITEEEIQAWYEENQQRFHTPEQVQVDYLEIHVDTITSGINVDEAELRIRYEARLESFRSPEERRASHILIRVDEDASEGDIRRARERTEAILARIRAGEDFATLAAEESEDPGSAAEGGDLGFFRRGVMVASFDDVAFAMEEGQVSELVRSPFGFHIIRLEERMGGELKPFDEVRADIERETRMDLAVQAYYELADRLANYTHEQPDTLVAAAEELGLEIKQSGFFTRRGGDGIAAHSRVVDVAFSDDVLLRGVNSDPLPITRDHTVVLRLNTHQPSAIQGLDEVRDAVVAALQRERSANMVSEQAQALVTSIEAGTSPNDAVASTAYQWQFHGRVGREDSELDPQLVDALFAMARPVGDGISLRRVSALNGDQYLLQLHHVYDGDPDLANATQRRGAEQMLRRTEASMIASALVQSIRDRTDIQIRR